MATIAIHACFTDMTEDIFHFFNVIIGDLVTCTGRISERDEAD